MTETQKFCLYILLPAFAVASGLLLRWVVSLMQKNDELGATVKELKEDLSNSRQRENQAYTAKHELTAAVRKHMNERGHDRCWLDDVELYKAAGAYPNDKDFVLPPLPEFMHECANHWLKRQPPITIDFVNRNKDAKASCGNTKQG